jgi:hypothetical protein
MTYMGVGVYVVSQGEPLSLLIPIGGGV